MFGSTSSFSPVSRYCTDEDTPTFAVDVVVITGTRSPMWILALSRFFTRIRGFARRLTVPSVWRRLRMKTGFATNHCHGLGGSSTNGGGVGAAVVTVVATLVVVEVLEVASSLIREFGIRY